MAPRVSEGGNVTTPAWREPIALLPAALPPLRKHIYAYMEYKRNRTTAATQRGYRSVLNNFERHYSASELSEFEPPAGTILVEDFLTLKWAHASGKTYNKGLSVLRGFFEWQVKRGNLKLDPTENIEEARESQYQRQTFTDEECARILAANYGAREQIATRLLLFYGIRKGALRNIRLGDFDVAQRRLTIFTKGQKYQGIPIEDATIWALLASLAEPTDHYLIPRQQQRRRRPPERKEMTSTAWLIAEARAMVDRIDDESCAHELAELQVALEDAERALRRAVDTASVQVKRYPPEQISDHAMHDLFYRWLARAEVVEKGATSGRRMHDCRHTAAQRILDHSGDMRVVQDLLGHSNSQVTEDYVGRNEDRLRDTLADVLQRQIPSPPRSGARV